jgi:6-phosphofructokinase 2
VAAGQGSGEMKRDGMLVLTVTPNPALDTVTEADEVVPCHKLRCDAEVRYPGGGGINVTRAMKELGCDSLALWTKGGALGDLIARLLDEEGVEHRPVHIAEGSRESFLVKDRSMGAFFRFGLPGPHLNAAEAESVVHAVATLDPKPDFIVASGSLPRGAGREVYPRLAKHASRTGSRLLIDCHSEDMERTLAAGPVYLLKQNDREFAEMTGVDRGDREALQRAARDLVQRGCAEVAVLTMGESGSSLITAEQIVHVAPPDVTVDSPIGAGDSMLAGLLCALVREWSLTDALSFGVAAAAAAVTTPGTELCRREDTERLYDRIREHGPK